MTRKTLRTLEPGSAAFVLEHAKWRASRGKRPSMGYCGQQNPKKARLLADACDGLNVIIDYAPILPECKSPRIGVRVRIYRLGDTRGILVASKHLYSRQIGKIGTLKGIVPGHGGDVWWVLHDEASIVTAYATTEFKRHSSKRPAPETLEPTIDGSLIGKGIKKVKMSREWTEVERASLRLLLSKELARLRLYVVEFRKHCHWEAPYFAENAAKQYQLEEMLNFARTMPSTFLELNRDNFKEYIE
jgi:hypothetical protein